jgi:hypothetical protein
LNEELKRMIGNITVSFHLVRFDLSVAPLKNSIVVSTSNTYIPSKIWYMVKRGMVQGTEGDKTKMLKALFETKTISDEEVMETIFFKYEGEYTVTGSMKRDFMEEEIKKDLYNPSILSQMGEKKDNFMMVFPTNPLIYFLSMCSSHPLSKRPENRFYPLRSEKDLYRRYLNMEGFMMTPMMKINNMEDFETSSALTFEVSSTLEKLVGEYYLRQRQFHKEKTRVSLTEDYTSIISRMTEGELTYQKVDAFNRVRHDLFMQVVLSLMGEDSSKKSDVDLIEELSYTGPKYFQTPDFLLFKDGKMIILDFAVTAGNAGNRRDDKVKKYWDLKEGISMDKNLDVEVEGVIWKINSHCNFFLPPILKLSEQEVWEHEAIKFLRKVYLNMEARPNFSKFKHLLAEEKEDQDLEDTLYMLETEIKNLITYKLNCHNLDLKARPLDSSRENLSFEDRVYQKKMLPKEMDCYKKYSKAMPMLGGKYIRQVEELYMNMAENKNLPEYQVEMLRFNIGEIMSMADSEKERCEGLRKKYEETHDHRIPKLFPFPLMRIDEDRMKNMTKGSSTFSYGDVKELLEDGTWLLDSSLDFEEQKEKEMDDEKMYPYPEEGIGFSVEEDVHVVEDFLEWMIEDMDEAGMCDSTYKRLEGDRWKALYRSNMWSLVDFMSNLAENICYLEGRRYKGDLTDRKGLIPRDTAKDYTVMKVFPGYILYVKRGSRLTKEKQIRIRIMAPMESILSNNSQIFKTMIETPFNPDLYQSKWLTISAPMLKHFVKLREVVTALYSNLVDKELESNRGKIVAPFTLTKTFATMVMVLMENKRGTSTTLQLGRYLLHSATSYMTNRTSLMSDINSDPIRTRMEAYIRIMQMKWYMKMLSDSETIWKIRVENLVSMSTDHDRFFTWSPFDLDSKVEFSVLMDCIYSCNLFEKDTGFVAHRVKAIMSKMVAAERKFLNVRESDWSKGDIDNLVEFWHSKDQLHMFDFKFVMSATKMFFKNKVGRLELGLAIEDALSGVIDQAMMMTSSLVSGPLSAEGILWAAKTEKTKTFLSIFDEVEKLGTSNLIEIVGKFTSVDAIFALFPKAQIGGPREILIQAVKLRLLVKFLELFSGKMCNLHPKEMLTKDHLKAQLQADYMNTNREEMIEGKNQGNPMLSASLNMDASKWAPGFVMEHFFCFVQAWDVPEDMKKVLLSIISAFSCKFMFTPETLREKWKRKPTDELESREDLEWFRKRSVDQSGVVEILSGMGQGMLHKMSSFYACVMDDAQDLVVGNVVRRMTGVEVKADTILSSDDKTKFLLFKCGNNLDRLEEALSLYIKCTDSITRLVNIHINWKKSGLNFLISEFNSLFSIGRRMVWASIKDIYNCNTIPDLSFPEDAVQQMLSSIRRCLEHGVYMTTIQPVCQMAHNQLRRYYRLDDSITERLCNTLDCTVDRLPYHLGYFPTTNLFSTIIMGKEVRMMSSLNSAKTKEFYQKLFSAQRNKMDDKMKNLIPFTEDSRGRFWFEMNMRMDKQLKEIKKDFFANRVKKPMTRILKEMDINSLNVNLVSNDMKSYRNFTQEYFVGMRRNYEFNELMTVHSLVRALQLSSKKAMVMPKTKMVMEVENEIAELDQKLINERKKTSEEDLIKIMERRKILQEGIKKLQVGVEEFVHDVLIRGKATDSTICLYDQLEGLEDLEVSTMEEMKKFPKTEKFYHGTMKKIRFYISPVGLSVRGGDVMKHMFEDNLAPSNRVVTTVDKLFSSLKTRNTNGGFSSRELYSNPFGSIKKLMSGSNYPMKDFKDFIMLNYKNMKFMEMIMISDTTCSGNFSDNLKKLMMSRSRPEFNYRFPSQEYTKDEKVTRFLSDISLNDNKPYKGILKNTDIFLSDSRVERGLKMYQVAGGEEPVPWENISSERVEYGSFNFRKDKFRSHFWTNFKMVVMAKEFQDKVEISYFSPVDLGTSEADLTSLLYLVDKFKNDMMNLKKKWVPMTLSNWSMKWNITYNRMNFFVKTYIKRGFEKWVMMTQFYTSFSSHLGDPGPMKEMTYIQMEDRYTVDHEKLMKIKMTSMMGEQYTMRDLLLEPPSIEDLAKMLTEEDLLPTLEMPLVKSKDETDDYKDVQDILEQFNSALGANSMMSSLTKMFKGNSRLIQGGNWDYDASEMMFLEEGESMLENESDYSSDSEDTKREKLKGWESLEDLEKREKRKAINLNNNNQSELGLLGMAKSIKKMMDKGKESDLLDQEDSVRRMKLNDILNSILMKAVECNLDYNRNQMKADFQRFKSQNNEITYHNLLLWQINWAFDFGIPDSMSLWIYNYLLSKTSTMHVIRPSKRLVKFGPELSSRIPKELIFISKKEERIDALDELMNFM